MRNCTAEETQKYIVEKFQYNCQEGSFCRVVDSNYYCECLAGWVGSLCNEMEFTLGRMSVFLPLAAILLMMIIALAVAGAYLCSRKKRLSGRAGV